MTFSGAPSDASNPALPSGRLLSCRSSPRAAARGRLAVVRLPEPATEQRTAGSAAVRSPGTTGMPWCRQAKKTARSPAGVIHTVLLLIATCDLPRRCGRPDEAFPRLANRFRARTVPASGRTICRCRGRRCGRRFVCDERDARGLGTRWRIGETEKKRKGGVAALFDVDVARRIRLTTRRRCPARSASPSITRR